MTELPHLLLRKAELTFERRKSGRPSPSKPRDQRQQTDRVQQAVADVMAAHAQLCAKFVDPRLIVRVRTAQAVGEEDWQNAGLTVLGQDNSATVVLFASDGELREFRRRLLAYAEPIPQGQKNPAYANLIGAIEDFQPVSPEDRIGPAAERRLHCRQRLRGRPGTATGC